MLINKKLKAFTIMELLVSMTLTGILVVFAFMGYNQIQKLFINYTVQSKFISDYNQLNKALFLLSDKSNAIEQTGDQIHFKTDSNKVVLDLANEAHILLKFNSHTDTFFLPTKNIQYNHLKLNNGTPLNLVTGFDCDVLFQSQKFHVSFHKAYDATNTLDATLVLLPPDEQY
jgi:Prokaryotic N-terminal methylation motif